MRENKGFKEKRKLNKSILVHMKFFALCRHIFGRSLCSNIFIIQFLRDYA